MTEDMIPVLPDAILNFNCNSKNVCFNECCRDLNQALTPYDVLRLKRNLNLSSQAFLKKYTALHHGPESGLPVIEFKPNPGTGYECPFVTSQGCSVYKDRPASCRMYPLARAIARSRETGDLNEYFALIEEPHCKGFNRSRGKTVRSWLDSQDVEKHNYENDKLIELISLKNKIYPGKLEGVLADKFYLGLYDLDEFRCQIFKKDLLNSQVVPKLTMIDIKTNDEALLNLGLQWVKYELFGIEMEFG